MLAQSDVQMRPPSRPSFVACRVCMYVRETQMAPIAKAGTQAMPFSNPLDFQNSDQRIWASWALAAAMAISDGTRAVDGTKVHRRRPEMKLRCASGRLLGADWLDISPMSS